MRNELFAGSDAAGGFFVCPENRDTDQAAPTARLKVKFMVSRSRSRHTGSPRRARRSARRYVSFSLLFETIISLTE